MEWELGCEQFEILTNLQKDQRMSQIENIPQLRLAPPAVYHEKVKKGIGMLAGESSSSSSAPPKIEKTSKSRQLRDLKAKGSSIRFPLRSNIFGTLWIINFKFKMLKSNFVWFSFLTNSKCLL